MVDTLKGVWQRRELVGLLVARNLKVRYKGTALGFLWSLLTPLSYILMYAVFASILRFNDGHPNYLQFLIVGVVTWQFLATCVHDSVHAIVGNVNLVKKTVFPRLILPLATVLANLVNFLLTCMVLTIYLLFVAPTFAAVWLLPLVVLTHSALSLGLALLLSASQVRFRDTEHVLGIGIMAWFFLTPVFYSLDFIYSHLDRLAAGARLLAFLNPMTGVVSAYRMVFLAADNPGWPGLLLSAAVCWIVLIVGCWTFQRAEWRFADEL
jgi:ABC-type polysaccharide/polyol phosphate export permease